MIRRKIPWTSQPQRPVGLNQDYVRHVNSARLWSLPAAVPSEAAQNSLGGYAKTGTIDLTPSPGGLGVKGDGSTGYYSRSVSVTPQAMWVMVQVVCSSVSATQRFVYGLGSAASSGGAFVGISFGNGTDSAIALQYRTTDGTGTALNKVGPVPSAGSLYTIVGVFPSALVADAYLYVNGVKYITNGSLTSTDQNFTGATTLVNESAGALKRGTVNPWSNDTLLFTARGLGQIPESLAKGISINPYLLLTPQERRVFVSVASSDLNITTILATADASGFTANIDRQLAIATSLGTATASGFTANVDRQLSITATLATATASGFTANVSSDLNVTATLATATASGFTANVDRQLSITTTLATVTASGFDASIALGGGLNITATSAVATASGFDAGIVTAQEIPLSTKVGGDDVPRTVRTLKYEPRKRKDNFGNEIIDEILKPIKQIKQIKHVSIVKPEKQAHNIIHAIQHDESDDEEALLMLL